MPWFGCTWKKPLHRNATIANRITEGMAMPISWCHNPWTKPATNRPRSSANRTARGMPDSEVARVSFMGISRLSGPRYHNDIVLQQKVHTALCWKHWGALTAPKYINDLHDIARAASNQ